MDSAGGVVSLARISDKRRQRPDAPRRAVTGQRPGAGTGARQEISDDEGAQEF